jgi:hypothetical protein
MKNQKKLFFLLLIPLFVFGTLLTCLEKDVLSLSPDKEKKEISNQQDQGFLLISEILGNGKYLLLSDQSVYEIEASFIPITKAWAKLSAVEIGTSDSSSYPLSVKNLSTQTAVEAKKVSLLDLYLETEKQKEEKLKEEKPQ